MAGCLWEVVQSMQAPRCWRCCTESAPGNANAKKSHLFPMWALPPPRAPALIQNPTKAQPFQGHLCPDPSSLPLRPGSYAAFSSQSIPALFAHGLRPRTLPGIGLSGWRLGGGAPHVPHQLHLSPQEFGGVKSQLASAQEFIGVAWLGKGTNSQQQW